MRLNRLRLPQGVLFWQEAGQGETILFLHGTWHDSSQWLPLLQVLAPYYHCIAPDLLGFGESAATSACSIALEVESLHDLLAPLRVQNFYIVAHSLGAWVALAMAQACPDRVKGIVVIEPEGFTVQALKRRWRLDRWLSGGWSPLAWLLSSTGPLLDRLNQGSWLHHWQQRRQRLRHAPTACRLLFRRRWSEIKAELIPTVSPELPMPIAVVESDNSTVIAHHLTQACLQEFPQSSHHILPAAANGLDLKYAAIGDVIWQMLNAEPHSARVQTDLPS